VVGQRRPTTSFPVEAVLDDSIPLLQFFHSFSSVFDFETRTFSLTTRMVRFVLDSVEGSAGTLEGRFFLNFPPADDLFRCAIARDAVPCRVFAFFRFSLPRTLI